MAVAKQREIFLSGGEGDRYFQRNHTFYSNGRSADTLSTAAALYTKYIGQGDRVLEVGSSSGVNLASICKATGCHGVGIDPSADATAEGLRLFPELEFRVGTADKLDFPDQSLDFILFGFCLYLVDREHITRVVAEADRCLRDGGWIGITDFMPDVPTARAYAHHAGITSYKLDYGRVFTAFPHFQLVESACFNHADDRFTADPQERLCAQVIHKELSGGYQRV
ncbi:MULTISPECIES: class I SAM-dependent methyltransferase [Pseudomonadota]|jgi:ubiquinone/menaquinone biosynthesis C-methylase UbiE|uniref:Class I SAM-dependent methyltransferase n=2 Tax=Ralstonia pickettii TaxID=329 RepID=A0A2P4RI93_RALPI|nr:MULTISPECIES: class I SAM-dependent methyltransferase [Ralstonia]MBA4274261.1 class I SAM-dependent methyltransferase [Alphaproteobacteria bacterium]MCL6486824.1 class I SAM-dependent methyltransferase [Janthinobacterium lividum]MBA4201685.1 class I SAM-dependent methyltransferase [Ralstonia sp.]MBA4231178.1 class I SAM-dependent methyltransferase [Ralstonia sp.]MBA4236749.1 class I SAM-dependent methyltransferase [Ralstonia sp.]